VQVARIHAHGDPSVIRVEDVPRPEPGPGQALVRVLGASINHLDLFVRAGMPGVEIPMPRALGCDGTGEVVALGPGVTGLRVGQKVVLEPGFNPGGPTEQADEHLRDDYGIRGEHADGFDAEYVAIEAGYCLPLPDGVDPVRAAAVPLVYLTAWTMLVVRAGLRADETVLVLGATSGVGSAAIQIAKDIGARVICTAGTAEKRELGLELGADAAVDHRAPDWHREVRRHNGGRGVDVVFEHVGPATWKSSMACLAKNGRLVTCGGTTGPKVELVLPHLFFKNLSVLGSTMGSRTALPAIFAKVANGAYRPVVHDVVPLSEVSRAHERLEAGEVLGKIVLVPGS
jgi:NADPH2:quinone reductase